MIPIILSTTNTTMIRFMVVLNVNDRIQLNFGKEYGLKVNSHPGEGTTCTLTLPLLYVQELSKDYNN